MVRVIASKKDISFPFKRYTIGPCWRYERPEPGRFREFYQADIDIVGTSDPISDAEVLSVAVSSLLALNLQDLQIQNLQCSLSNLKALSLPLLVLLLWIKKK